MKKKILSEDSRERLVAAYEKMKDISTVAMMFGVAESTVYRLAAQKRKTGSLALQTHKRGVKPKLTPQMLEQIKKKVEEVPDITLQELIDELNLPVKVPALCDAILHKLKLTRKKMIHATEKNRPDVVKKREELIKYHHNNKSVKILRVSESLCKSKNKSHK